MSGHLFPVGEPDGQRAACIASFLSGYRPQSSSARTMRSALRSVARLVPEHPGDFLTFPWELAAEPVLYDEIGRRIDAAVSPATATKYRVALRQLLRHLARHGLVDPPVLMLTLGTERRRRPSLADETRGLNTDELAAMLRFCRRDVNSMKGARDAALLALLAGTGARRSEAAGLLRCDLDTGRAVAQMTVKGGGRRNAYLGDTTLAHLGLWLPHLPAGPGVFVPVDKAGNVVRPTPVSAHAVWKVVGQRRDEAGLDPAITPHSFRRWFVTSLLHSGADILSVTRAVGHRSPKTTQRYDRRGEDVLRAAVLRLPMPSLSDTDPDEQD